MSCCLLVLNFTYLEFSDAGFVVVEIIICMGTASDALPVGLHF